MAVLLGKNPNEYSSHSMRRTEASLMAANGCSDQQIKTMGNWSSNNVAQKYVQTSYVTMRKNAKTIAMLEALFFPPLVVLTVNLQKSRTSLKRRNIP